MDLYSLMDLHPLVWTAIGIGYLIIACFVGGFLWGFKEPEEPDKFWAVMGGILWPAVLFVCLPVALLCAICSLFASIGRKLSEKL